MTALALRAPVAAPSVADALASALAELGVTLGFGIIGGAIAPFARSLARHAIRVVHSRHEGGAAFAAVEACFASGRPSAVFATTGPGTLNALTGLAAARWEGARVVLVSGATSSDQRGRWAFQETSALAPQVGPGLFHYAHSLESADELAIAVQRLRAGFARPHGFVAHLALPLAVQTAASRAALAPASSHALPSVARETLARVAAMVGRVPVALWVGFGARDAAGEVRRLAERLHAPVMCSPRGKGIFPESHPLFAGVTGLGGHEAVARKVGAARLVLVLGTRLGELTSFWDPALVAPEGFIHVDLDPDVPGSAYPLAPTLAIHSEIGAFARALLGALGRGPRRTRTISTPPPAAAAPPASRSPVRPSVLLAEIQRTVVDSSDAIVLTEAGNAFVWGSRGLRFERPRYRVSTGFGSMGQATAGVVGAALARGKAVALVGDGAMLMNSEVSTAVRYGAPAVWIVLNDSRYGMIEAGMRSQGWAPLSTAIPATCFATIARAMGAGGVRVADEAELRDALAQALAAPGPFVVDVIVDPAETPPISRRIDQLIAQGAHALRPEETIP